MPDTWARERVLVTGGSGFLGQHLLRALVANRCRPVATTRSLTELRVSRDIAEGVQWIEVDLAGSDSAERLRQIQPPRIVFHLAGARIPDTAERAQELNRRQNVTATENLLLVARNHWELARFIATGSAEEYGDRDGAIDEEAGPAPHTSYGQAKARVAALIADWTAETGAPTVWLRPFSVYGPGQPRQMFIAQAVEAAVSGVDFAMTEGRQKRDLVYVSDVIQALLAAAGTPGLTGKAINIGSGRPRPLREVAQMIWHLSGASAELMIGARPAPLEELHDTWADITRARELLKWEPAVELAAGLRETIEWERGKLAGIRSDRVTGSTI